MVLAASLQQLLLQGCRRSRIALPHHTKRGGQRCPHAAVARRHSRHPPGCHPAAVPACSRTSASTGERYQLVSKQLHIQRQIVATVAAATSYWAGTGCGGCRLLPLLLVPLLLLLLLLRMLLLLLQLQNELFQLPLTLPQARHHLEGAGRERARWVHQVRFGREQHGKPEPAWLRP